MGKPQKMKVYKLGDCRHLTENITEGYLLIMNSAQQALEEGRITPSLAATVNTLMYQVYSNLKNRLDNGMRRKKEL